MLPVVERFLRYAQVHTQSDRETGLNPSTPGQLKFAYLLQDEMTAMGMEDVTVDDYGYVMGFVPSNAGRECPSIGFIAHMDTSPDMSGKHVKPQIIADYKGTDILLNKELPYTLSPDDFPELRNYVGDDLIVADGHTLLGADDKAGIAEILTAMEYLIQHPEIRHGRIAVCFTPDEEIGEGVEHFDLKRFGAKFAYTLDGGEIPVSVYTQLIDTVHENLPLMYRYAALRKKALGVEELHMYDLYAPMVDEVNMKIPFEEAKEIVKKGLAPLGEEYIRVLSEGMDGGWIDVYENQGKRSGAYSWGAYGCHPFVLMNYQDNLNNVFTLAHEMGHSMHSYYSDKNQPYLYAGYRIFVAEVASTCNEALLMEYLLKHTEDKKEKAYLINYFLEQFKGTLYRQTMFAEFEKITHEKAGKGEPLTAEILNDIYYKLNEQYFGDGVVIDKEIALEWSRIPHFYTPFYVYQYATGYSAAIAISRKILSGDEEAREGYMKFLSGGSSMNPIDLLRLCGVDMTTKEPVESALKLFGELLDEMETLLA